MNTPNLPHRESEVKALAYDYDTQQWVEGPAAILIRQRQLIEELELLTGPEGESYFAFIQRGCEPDDESMDEILYDQYVAVLQQELLDLNVEDGGAS